MTLPQSRRFISGRFSPESPNYNWRCIGPAERERLGCSQTTVCCQVENRMREDGVSDVAASPLSWAERNRRGSVFRGQQKFWDAAPVSRPLFPECGVPPLSLFHSAASLSNFFLRMNPIRSPRFFNNAIRSQIKRMYVLHYTHINYLKKKNILGGESAGTSHCAE